MITKKRIIISGVVLLLLSSCVSIDDLVMRKAGAILASDSSGSVFTGDEDPQLVADALPLTMKLYEMVLAEQPNNPALNFAAGKNFILYANAFIQTPADILSDDEWKQKEAMLKRAKKMYLRGRNYVLQSLTLSYPGWKEMLNEEGLEGALALCTPEDVPRLYWAASAWIGAFSCDPFDFELASGLAAPTAMLLRGLQMDGGFNNGAIHSIFIQIYASLPEMNLAKALNYSPNILTPFIKDYYAANGISSDRKERSFFHFEQAVALSAGSNPGPYLAAAKSLAVPEQDYPFFENCLQSALAIDPESYPEKRLEITIYQEKAAWMMENRGNYFIIDFEGNFE